MRLLTFTAAAVLAAASGGCAFATVDVHPPPKPNPPVAVVRDIGRGREIILVAPFVDARLHARCGMQMNGYRMDTADVVCTEPPGLWVADALAIELSRAGYKVLRADAVPGPSTVVVKGTVKQLFLEPHDGFLRTVEGDIAAELEVTSASGLHATRTFYVKGSEEGLASTEGAFQAAADDATVRITHRMVRAITDLLDTYPDLGRPEATSRVAMSSAR